jgi:hypothetical protein
MRCGNRVFIAAAATSARRLRVRKGRKHGGGKCEMTGRRRIMDAWANRPRPMGHQKKEGSENRAVGNQGSGLRAHRPQRFIELQEVDGRAVCRRGFEMRRNKKLAQVFSNSIEPGFRCGMVAGKRAKKWIAHAEASVSASRFGPTTSGGGHQSASQKSSEGLWLPAVKVLSIQREMQARTSRPFERRELIQHGKSIQPESHFDRHLHGHNLAARSCSWSKLPRANGLHCFLPEAHAGILNDGNVHGAAIGGDGHL